MQRPNRQFGRGGDDLQQGQGRAGRMAAVLLPILQGAHAHAQQARKIGLGAIGVQINPSANPAGTAERSTGPRSRTSGSKARNWTI